MELVIKAQNDVGRFQVAMHRSVTYSGYYYYYYYYYYY